MQVALVGVTGYSGIKDGGSHVPERNGGYSAIRCDGNHAR
ncbi:hypothetical protein IMAU80824_01392 [Lactiplantibacillus plantarum]|nr:hypothetical protein [Lactiplantibacillus plantarum]